ncbi:uncharacterized protein LOC106943532 [Poecilia latipinna]|uniref:uncharacterized protein LOC106943532 n=1 Tax=Poecilia latipinna TaxID=48699 RepID=UPI00072E3C40|nr:PREDICTED: uncharacterized protein LOC106943532 [Poecilia latipinna]
METSEDKEEEAPLSETTLCKKPEDKRNQTERESDMESGQSDLNQLSATKRKQEQEPGPSCLSFKSTKSKDAGISFNIDEPSDAVRSDQSPDVVQPPHESQMRLGSIFVELEKKIVMFVKDELKEIQKVLSSDYPDEEEEEGVSGNKDEKQRSSSSREAFLKITVDFLRMMNLDDLADLLQSSKRYSSTEMVEQEILKDLL